jgi:hypothetical protein
MFSIDDDGSNEENKLVIMFTFWKFFPACLPAMLPIRHR